MTISIASGNLSIVSRGRFNAITIYKATKRRSQWRLPPLFVPLFSQTRYHWPVSPKTGSAVENGRSGDEIYRRAGGKKFSRVWRELAFSHTYKNHSLWFTRVNSAACSVIEVLSGKQRRGGKRGRKRGGEYEFRSAWEIKKKRKTKREKVWCIVVMVL